MRRREQTIGFEPTLAMRRGHDGVDPVAQRDLQAMDRDIQGLGNLSQVLPDADFAAGTREIAAVEQTALTQGNIAAVRLFASKTLSDFIGE